MSAQEEVRCPKAEFECPCIKKNECENFGICCKCVTRHRGLGSPVYCMREGVLQKPQA
jgi:hypothetical protein